MAAITVTATGAGGSPYGWSSLTVLVLTGALESGGASAAVNAAPAQVSLTPAFSHSLPVAALMNEDTATAFTLAAGNTALNSATFGGLGVAAAQEYYSGTVTAGTPVTAGSTAPSSADLTIAVYEVPPSGGGTPVQDGSAPPPVSPNTATATTAAFTPPAGGAVLAALVSTPGGSAPGYALTVSDSSGLAWTRRAHIGPGPNAGVADVWTATVPPAFQIASSTPSVTDPRDGTATVTDPRDGTATVTGGAVVTLTGGLLDESGSPVLDESGGFILLEDGS